eukprot:1136136-Pelagomonas_calceolata.AAC.2
MLPYLTRRSEWQLEYLERCSELLDLLLAGVDSHFSEWCCSQTFCASCVNTKVTVHVILSVDTSELSSRLSVDNYKSLVRLQAPLLLQLSCPCRQVQLCNPIPIPIQPKADQPNSLAEGLPM